MDYDLSQTKAFLSRNKYLVSSIKFIIFMVSAYYLFVVINKNYFLIRDIALIQKSRLLSYLLMISIVNVLLLFILAQAWKALLQSITARKYNTTIIAIYLQSLIYKYIPGNVFHYANRQIMAHGAGIKHKALLLSNVYEAVGLIIAALIFSIFIFINSNGVYLEVSLGLLILVVLASYYFRKSQSVAVLLKPIPYYMLYFLGIGLICYYLINHLAGNSVPLLQCISLYSVAWIAGFIVPGAPGGIGVRESVFLLLADGLISQPQAILVITLLRLSTTLAEILVYFYGKISDRHRQNGTSNW
jgi:hypothetical protein